MLQEKDFKKLRTQLEEGHKAYHFDFLDVFRWEIDYGRGHFIRLFETANSEYCGEGNFGVWERLTSNPNGYETEIAIKHFQTSRECARVKRQEWYSPLLHGSKLLQQSKCPNYKNWKKPNPLRNLFI
jgi:hypothetical protein